MANNCPRCGAGLRGWERICSDCKGKPPAFGEARIKAPPAPIPIAPVTVTPKATKPASHVTITPSHVTDTVTRYDSAHRMAEMRKRKAQAGLIEVRGIFAHPDDHAVIKTSASNISAKRSK